MRTLQPFFEASKLYLAWSNAPRLHVLILHRPFQFSSLHAYTNKQVFAETSWWKDFLNQMKALTVCGRHDHLPPTSLQIRSCCLATGFAVGKDSSHQPLWLSSCVWSGYMTQGLLSCRTQWLCWLKLLYSSLRNCLRSSPNIHPTWFLLCPTPPLFQIF